VRLRYVVVPTIFLVAALMPAELDAFEGLFTICSTDWHGFTGSWLRGGARVTPVSLASAPPARCPPAPAGYQSLPSVTATGDVNVALLLGTGTGVGTGNPNLCFIYESFPVAPVIRVKQGNRLTIALTNTLENAGPDNTENCAIQNYGDGPPVSAACKQPEHGFQAALGPDGEYYQIQTNIPHLADGATNLHSHGLEVSPQPCHDEVLQSRIVAANWGGPLGQQLPCQSAPNELTYSYDIGPDHPTGLYFFHTHLHGHALAQTMMGATGAIVIEGEDDVRRAALGVTDEVMIVRDFPSTYAPDQSAPVDLSIVPARVPGGALAGPPADPKIDRENQVSCPTGASDAGGPPITRLTLNGALVKETAAFPPPDDKVPVKAMAPGERQLWRLVNATGDTYVSPQLVLSENGKTRVLPLEIVALDGAPVHDDVGNRRLVQWDTSKRPLLLATANRVEFLVHAPPPGATLYLDSLQVTGGCAGDGMPARRLLRAVSTGEPKPGAPAPSTDDDLLPSKPDTTDTHLLDSEPAVKRVIAFTEYPRSFTVSKSKWIVGPPGPHQYDPNETDFLATMTKSSDGEAQSVALKPFALDAPPEVVVHLHGQDSVVEEWTIQNYTLEIHSFHIHQMHFVDATERDRIDGLAPIIDTVNVPPAARGPSAQAGVDIPTDPGFVTLRMRFTRGMIGDFVFHCHVLEHEDRGMMQRVRVVAD
jgi:FtsP/CotA-like multicopper oxidase with cupredoxin domain